MLILGPEAANAMHGNREHGKSIIAMLLKYYSSVEIGLMERYTIHIIISKLRNYLVTFNDTRVK